MSLPFRFWDKSLYAFLISSMRAACSVLSHYLITLFDKEYTLQSASICIFLFLPFTSFPWSQNILCITLFSYTINLLVLWFVWCDSYGVIHFTRWLCGESHPYKTRCVIVALCVLISTFLGGRYKDNRFRSQRLWEFPNSFYCPFLCEYNLDFLWIEFPNISTLLHFQMIYWMAVYYDILGFWHELFPPSDSFSSTS
jgi:hypothetical protein